MAKITSWRGIQLETPATYRIRVQGRIDSSWSNRLGGMSITEDTSANPPGVTILVGHLTDQASLSGILNALYDLHLPLLSVENLDEKKTALFDCHRRNSMKNLIRLATTDSTRRQSRQPIDTARKTVIALSDLRFGWKSDQIPVLDIETLAIQTGGRVFIAGPSGCGKSTLLSLLAGVVVPQQGSVSVLGRRLDALNGYQRDRFRADHIGFIFQMFNLIPYLSVVENVILPCRFSAKRRKNILARGSGPEEEALRLLQQLGLAGEEILNRPVTELSVGQQQRVAAARALIGSPEIVIADEPTSSLDADHREAFLRLLFRECERAQSTLIFVSHDTGLAEMFDQKIALRKINRARCWDLGTGTGGGGDLEIE